MKEKIEKPLQTPEDNPAETSSGDRPFSELVSERLNGVMTSGKLVLSYYVGLKSYLILYQQGVDITQARIISSVLAATVGATLLNPPSKSVIMSWFKRGM